MLVYPNAKINIGLHIKAKRADGFHQIETVFYPVPVYDMLEAIPAKKLHFSTSGVAIPQEGDSNICLKAYYLLLEKFDLPPVKIHLHKNIPVGAGLGGGSADAAFMLTLLNDLFCLNLSPENLSAFALQLGSDVPFFLRNKAVFASGRGEVFTDIPVNLTNKYLVIVFPDIHIDTRSAYAHIIPQTPANTLKTQINAPLKTWKNSIVNNFEKDIFAQYPILLQIKEYLYQMGAIYASMSGSGSAMYGIFRKKISILGLAPSHKIFQCCLE